MIKKILLLLVLAGLVACGSTPKSFSTFPHSTSQTPRLHAATVDDRLAVRPSLELRVLGVPYGYVQSAGLIAAGLDQMETGKSRDAIYPLLESLSGFSFKDHFEKTLREKILSPGYLPAHDVRYEMAPDRFSKMRSGTVVINAYQRISMLFSTLWVGVTAHHFDDSSGSLEVRRTIYLYEFRLPQAEETFEERQFNADEWISHSGVVEHLLKTGMDSAMDMLVSDLRGEIVIQETKPIDIGYQHLLGRSPKMKLISENGDRIVVADSSKTLVASLSASALEGSKVKPKSLAQIKMESGVLDTPTKEKKIMLTATDTTTENAAAGDQGIVDFMGQAEDEIHSRTYDKNLWAKALVDAEGDQQKRVWIYIKLRAQQLYVESGGTREPKAAAAPAPAAEIVEFDLAGRYETRLTGYTFYFTRLKNRPVVVIRQNGNSIEGEISNVGTFTGVIKDNQLELEWITTVGEGTAKLKISRAGKKLKGEWKSVQEGFGSWTMQRR